MVLQWHFTGLDGLTRLFDHYKEAIRLHPDRPDTYADLGMALAQAGRLREAVPYMEKALALRPNFTRVQRALAQIREELAE